MLNALRLNQGISLKFFEERTRLSIETIKNNLKLAIDEGLLEKNDNIIIPTSLGKRFLNDLIAIFLPNKD